MQFFVIFVLLYVIFCDFKFKEGTRKKSDICPSPFVSRNGRNVMSAATESGYCVWAKLCLRVIGVLVGKVMRILLCVYQADTNIFQPRETHLKQLKENTERKREILARLSRSQTQ